MKLKNLEIESIMKGNKKKVYSLVCPKCNKKIYKNKEFNKFYCENCGIINQDLIKRIEKIINKEFLKC